MPRIRKAITSDGHVTSDTVGLARERIEKEEGVPQIYFTGCGGDITAGKYNNGSPEARRELTDRLAAGMRAVDRGQSDRGDRSDRVARHASCHAATARRALYAGDRTRGTGERKASPTQRIVKGAMLVAWIDRQDTPIELSSLSIGPVTIVHLPGRTIHHVSALAQKLGGDRFVAVAGYGDGGAVIFAPRPPMPKGATNRRHRCRPAFAIRTGRRDRPAGTAGRKIVDYDAGYFTLAIWRK